ncbi:MAG: hypothetical protein HRS50_01065, partial [Mycoplasmataceae bacterium]|nr:hypothetical protein [Mycoplasmataceae bacterium]
KYGFNREGNLETINNFFNLEILEDVKLKEIKYSTTNIIKTIYNQDLIKYKNLMNQYFSYKGIIVKGLGNGKKFGMPTANVTYPVKKIDIGEGIFYSYVTYNKKRWNSLTSISYNPTLGANNKTYETFIYDFNENIYGKEIFVELIEKYRDPIKFSSIDELIKKLDEDKKIGKEYFIDLKKGKI